jgi:Peptidase family C25
MLINLRSLFAGFCLLAVWPAFSQANFDFNFATSGQRVCLLSTTVDLAAPSVTIHFLDADQNLTKPSAVYRRPLNDVNSEFTLAFPNFIPAGTASWTDTNVSVGEAWEYMVIRSNSWVFDNVNYNASGFTNAVLRYDRSVAQGQMILLVADNIANALPDKLLRLKRDLVGDGWRVNELVVPADTDWDGGQAAQAIRTQLKNLYDAAPSGQKPSHLFILGHVPLPRSGSTDVPAPDEHNENKGARGADTYYADLDGEFTDVATYNPGGLSTPLAINQPGDFRWDQDFIPSRLEMAFGRVDFRDLTDLAENEVVLTERYLDRLHQYRHVAPGWWMGNRTGFFFGYDNSNDGSYRSLPNITLPDSVLQKTDNSNNPAWVKNNGPFMVYMQNVSVPEMSEWNTDGMEATVFSSDQSYWGWADVPQENTIYSRIRALLAADTKCLVTLWTTTGLSQFHQAGGGISFGGACRRIMDHSFDDQVLPKPPQTYDTNDWWNRTHFAFQGDPTLRLHQVMPPSNFVVADNGSNAELSWQASPDPRLFGYHIYRSSDEMGPYERLTETPITAVNFSIDNHEPAYWYMVRAVIEQTTGSGVFINPSQGLMAQGTMVNTNAASLAEHSVRIAPNPVTDDFSVVAPLNWEKVTITNALGQVMRVFQAGEQPTLRAFPQGVYTAEIGFGVKVKPVAVRLVRQ